MSWREHEHGASVIRLMVVKCAMEQRRLRSCLSPITHLTNNQQRGPDAENGSPHSKCPRTTDILRIPNSLAAFVWLGSGIATIKFQLNVTYRIQRKCVQNLKVSKTDICNQPPDAMLNATNVRLRCCLTVESLQVHEFMPDRDVLPLF